MKLRTNLRRPQKITRRFFYKYPLADESKDAAIALTRLNKQLHSEFPYATGEMQDQRAQIFYDAHKWARSPH